MKEADKKDESCSDVPLKVGLNLKERDRDLTRNEEDKETCHGTAAHISRNADLNLSGDLIQCLGSVDRGDSPKDYSLSKLRLAILLR